MPVVVVHFQDGVWQLQCFFQPPSWKCTTTTGNPCAHQLKLKLAINASYFFLFCLFVLRYFFMVFLLCSPSPTTLRRQQNRQKKKKKSKDPSSANG